MFWTRSSGRWGRKWKQSVVMRLVRDVPSLQGERWEITRVYPNILYRFDSLRAGRSGDRIPVGARFSAPVQTGPGAYPASCTMGTGSFPGVKRPGRGADHPAPPKRPGHERVELYIYSPSGPSWPALGRTLLFIYFVKVIWLQCPKISASSIPARVLGLLYKETIPPMSEIRKLIGRNVNSSVSDRTNFTFLKVQTNCLNQK